MTPVIEVEGLVKVYGDGERSYKALDALSFSIGRGRFASIMGPSGCGKSTLLNVLGLMDRPTSGTYRFDGEHVESLSDGTRTEIRRRRVGFVFQSFNLLPRMTALQNVCLPMTYEGVPKAQQIERGLSLLEKVGLTGKERNTPLELSGGERQRVGIARALANAPILLLADEPTGNLDSRTAIEVLELFSGLHAEGMTILIVTHDRAVADRTERILQIRDGRIVQSGEPAGEA